MSHFRRAGRTRTTAGGLRKRAGTPRALAGLIAAAAVLLIAPAPAAAQRAAAVDSTRGWLGIGLRETLRCPSGTRGQQPERSDDCRSFLVVQAVFRSSPAERAGIAPGDILLEVGGAPLGTEAAARRLRTLRPGRAVELLLGREGGRRSVTVTPAPRPRAPEPAALRVARPEAPGGIAVTVRPRVVFGTADSAYAVPLPELPEAPEVAFDTELLEGIHVDEQGRVFLEREDQLIRLRRLERMAARLRAVGDSTLETARERIRAVQAELRRGGAPEAPTASLAGPAGPHRALGAELWTVSPELARSLRNVEHGMLVLKVLPGTPAAALGLRSGDVLVRVGGTPVRTARDLRAPFLHLGAYERMPVRWIRGGEVMTDTLRTGD